MNGETRNDAYSNKPTARLSVYIFGMGMEKHRGTLSTHSRLHGLAFVLGLMVSQGQVLCFSNKSSCNDTSV